jgi:transposase
MAVADRAVGRREVWRKVATRVGKSVLTVRRWRRRYAVKGVDGLLKDATRPPGRKPLTARRIK